VCAEQFLVTVSRGREGVRIYTDDKEALKRNILRSSQRPSATELMSGEVTREGRLHSVEQAMQAAAWRYLAHRKNLESSVAKDMTQEIIREERSYGGPVMER
jgi:hypothetical protein